MRFAFVLLWLFVAAIPVENALVLPGVGTASRLMGFVAFPFCLAAIIERGRLRPLSPLHGLMAVHVLWIYLTYFWTVDRTLTLQAMGTYAQLLVMVWLFWELAVRRHQQVALLKAYVWGATVSALATLTLDVAAATQHYQRYAAFSFDPNDMGLILALSVPISFYLAATETRLVWCWLRRFQASVAIAAVLMTSTRGAMLALCGGLVLILFNFSRWELRQRTGILIVLLLALGSAILFVPASSWKRVAGTANELLEGNLNERTLIWKTGWDEFRENPFLGVGAGAFAMTAERRLGQPRVGSLVAHNVYLSVLFETGVVGLFIYASLLMAMVLAVLQMRRPVQNFWLTTLLIWGIGVCSLTWEYRKPTWFLFGMLTAQTAGWAVERRQPLRSEPRRGVPHLEWRTGGVSQ